MDLKRRDEAENKERIKDKKVMKERKENDIPKVRKKTMILYVEEILAIFHVVSNYENWTRCLYMNNSYPANDMYII